MGGTWMTLNLMPAFWMTPTFHGPVSQNGALPVVNGAWHVVVSTFELIRPSLFHLSISGAFFRKVGLATPMSEGSRLPALFVPKM